MQLSDFQYELPPELIAQTQADPRDHARLMLIDRQKRSISHHHIYDLPTLLPKNYFIVANNTKVFPARILGHKPTGGKVEILLTQPLGSSKYKCIARPGLKIGDTVMFPSPNGSLTGTVISVNDMERTIRFNQEESHLRTTLSQIGSMPTPPYIKKLLGNSKDYQTIYAKYGFSAAAPTAGLHFTPALLKKIKMNHNWLELTLNVGLGTFLPVKENNLANHHMHEETYTISPTTANKINNLRSQELGSDNKLLSIGTTTMRALESNSSLLPRSTNRLSPGSYATDIFIYPPYEFQATSALMTNFHLPGSTLLMLVSAFCTYPNAPDKFTTFHDSLLGEAYRLAVQEKYRFFSFGDAMLII